jgi:glycosyltransferase involved in cell wall biosynthesis
MKRLLVVAERLGAEGGMERFLEVLLGGLAARGIAIHVLARILDAVPAGVTAEQIDWRDEHHAPDPASAAAVAAILRSAPYDAVAAHNVMDAGVLEALRLAPRFGYHVHDHRPFCPNGDRVFPRTELNCTAPLGAPCAFHALTDGCAYGPRPRSAALIRRRMRLRDAIAAADVVVVGSAYMAERARASGIPRERIRQLASPLPDDAYTDGVTSAVSGGVLFAGRIVPQKGLRSLVRAVATISPGERPAVRAIGEGPERAGAAAEAAASGVALDLPGAMNPADVRRAIDDAALVAVPSLWAEPFGMIGIEAFARARPVVAYDVGGIRSWLSDGENGLSVPRADERGLGRSIARLLGDDGLRATMGARARRDAERYRLAPFVDAVIAAVAGTRSGESPATTMRLPLPPGR